MIGMLEILIWIGAIFCSVGCIMTVRGYRHMQGHIRRSKELWAASAPPVPPVVVVLKTGDRLLVEPTNVHQAWVWQVRVPADPDDVDELLLDELPPWTTVIPIPPDVHKMT